MARPFAVSEIEWVTWRLTDLSRAAMTAVGDTRLRHRISLFLQGMMEEGRVERVSRGLYRWI